MSLRLQQGGYTVIEMVTIVGIIMILTAIVLANTKVGDRRQQLRDAADLYVTAAKQAEAMAASAQVVGGTSRKAYGVCITSEESSTPCTVGSDQNAANAVEVYARTLTDCGPTKTCPPLDPPSTLAARPTSVNKYRLPRNVHLYNQTGTYLDFLPPGPTAKLNGQDADLASGDLTVRFFAGLSDSFSRSIIIRSKAGAVYVTQ